MDLKILTGENKVVLKNSRKKEREERRERRKRNERQGRRGKEQTERDKHNKQDNEESYCPTTRVARCQSKATRERMCEDDSENRTGESTEAKQTTHRAHND